MREPLVEVSTTIKADAGEVWKHMTQRKSAMFMGAEVDSDWMVGHPIKFSGEFKGKKFEDHGKIKSLKKNHELSFTHFSPSSGKPDKPENYNLVAYRLENVGDDCTKVTLTQTPLSENHSVPDTQKEAFRKNWLAMLNDLKKASEH
jgi:uncharacterized protein YndB with AHSA1/START domain